jgi:putative ABC transport system permease protein
MLRLLLAGHRSVLAAVISTLALLTAVAGGVIGTVVRAAGAADDYRNAPVVTTDTAYQWGVYQGIVNYAGAVAALACVVGMILLASVSQFTVGSLAGTSRSLRLLGASRRRIRYGLVVAMIPVGIVGLAVGTLLSPAAAWAFRWILERTGMQTSELAGVWTPVPVLITGASLVVWALLALWWQARHLAGIEADAPHPGRFRRVLRILAAPLRYTVGIAAAVGLWAMLRATMTFDNYNQMAFGIALCTLFVVWSLTPLVLRGIGRLLRSGGTGRMIVGGIASAQGRRIAGMSLIAALLIVLGGTAAFAALTASTGSKYQGAASLQVDAVADADLTPDQTTAARDAGLTVSPSDTDTGWLEGDRSVDTVTVNRVDPAAMAQLLVPGTVTAGSLADVHGDNVAGDGGWQRKIGDTVLIRDDAGARREVHIVATVDTASILGDGITVDAASFPVSVSGATATTYAAGVGGLDTVQSAVPGADWTSHHDYLDDGLTLSQKDQMLSLAGMVGGIGVVAVIALLHAVVGFAADLGGVRRALRRLSFSWRRVIAVFSELGATVGLAAGVVSAVALAVVQHTLAGLLTGMGVTTPMAVPWPLLAGLWAVVVVACVAGMAVQPVQARVKDAG